MINWVLSQSYCSLNIPVGTQRCDNVEIWLKYGRDVDRPKFNVDLTSWYSTLTSQRCFNVEFTSLKSTFKQQRLFNVGLTSVNRDRKILLSKLKGTDILDEQIEQGAVLQYYKRLDNKCLI